MKKLLGILLLAGCAHTELMSEPDCKDMREWVEKNPGDVETGYKYREECEE